MYGTFVLSVGFFRGFTCGTDGFSDATERTRLSNVWPRDTSRGHVTSDAAAPRHRGARRGASLPNMWKLRNKLSPRDEVNGPGRSRGGPACSRERGGSVGLSLVANRLVRFRGWKSKFLLRFVLAQNGVRGWPRGRGAWRVSARAPRHHWPLK